MQVVEVWRYPVKSFAGQRVPVASFGPTGMDGDREYAVRDTATGRILTGRREPSLLLAAATLDAGGAPVITLPDGSVLTGTGATTDAALSAWLGHDVSLVAAASEPAGIGEFFADSTDDTSATIEWAMPEGRYVDLLPLLVLTTASLRAGAALHPDGVWDVRRFRPNLLVEAEGDDFVEDGWRGSVLRIGTAEIDVHAPCVRCTMVTRPQPGLARDLDVYRALARGHGGTFGMWSAVRTPGTVSEGDAVEVHDPA